jgi:bifunctional DNA-binding transcriptional regulator/antitoxin component of YhaV-PrlF toxin-antitoxin module
MRPDGTSYYVVIPKKIRETFRLKRWRILHHEGKAGERKDYTETGEVRRGAGKRTGNGIEKCFN